MNILSDHHPEVLERLNAVPENVDEPRQDDAPAEWNPRPLTDAQAQAMACHYRQPAVTLQEYVHKVEDFYGFVSGLQSDLQRSLDTCERQRAMLLGDKLVELRRVLDDFHAGDYMLVLALGCTCQSHRNGD
jgi:hypothetical protein